MSAWIDINLARSSQWRKHRLYWRLVFGGTLLLIWGVVNFIRFTDFRDRIRVAESTMQTTLRQQQPVSTTLTAEQARSHQALQQMLLQLGFPWEDLFGDIEAAVQGDLKLESLQPQPEKSQVLIKVAAKDIQTVIEFVSDLQHQKMLDSARLVSEIYSDNTPARNWHATIEAAWNSAQND